MFINPQNRYQTLQNASTNTRYNNVMTSSEEHTHCTRTHSIAVANPFIVHTEVHLNASIAPFNPFNNNINNIKIIPPSSDLPDPPTSLSKDSSIKIRTNTSNRIIHTNLHESTSTPDNEVSRFTLNTKIIYREQELR